MEHPLSTKIVATLGPATDGPGRLRALIEAGVDVVRLNFSHGAHEAHAERVAAVRAAADEVGRPVAILQDLQGPKIRTGTLTGGGPVELSDGAEFRLFVGDEAGDAAGVGTTYAGLPGDVGPGDRILLSDGLIELRVEASAAGEVRTRVVTGGSLRERQGINLPGVAVDAPSLTEKDRSDLAFGLDQGVDWVALSFVRAARDVVALKQEIERAGHDTPVIAKIEKPQALDALDEILDVTDGVMVARGDLGVELSPERVPLAQKHLIHQARRRAVPVITATEMLQSMIEQPRPTRAEASDVANAILDGSDAVMLSGETAVGEHPVAAVRTMARIARVLEDAHREGRLPPPPLQRGPAASQPEAIATAVAAVEASVPDLRIIAVLSRSGRTARYVSSARPALPIVGFTPEARAAQRMALFWGVKPIVIEEERSEAAVEARMVEAILENRLADRGDAVVFAGGHPLTEQTPTNFLKLRRL